MSVGTSSPSTRTITPRRVILVLSAAIVLAAWGVAAYTYAVDGGGDYNGGLFTIFILVAAALTIASATLVVQAWREKLGLVYPPVVSVLAALSVLWLATAINLRG
jgi:hypothetical protein